ncbi:hypothetical protein [Allocoleopsis sp.]|uniref:hypothetical protein n=1 Tax=Allocoleopsis sp. TaxID=3088169 RepID=UPI002FD2326F
MNYIPLAARICLSLIFLYGGIKNITGFSATQQMIAARAPVHYSMLTDVTGYAYLYIHLSFRAKHSGDELSRTPKIFRPNASPLHTPYSAAFVKYFYWTGALGHDLVPYRLTPNWILD